MIYSLRGELTEKLEDSVILDVNGIGYEVFLGSKSKNLLNTGENVFLYTRMVIGENEQYLYGFENKETLEIFRLLTKVSGIGPKTAFNVIDTGSGKEIIDAISNADKNFFKSVSGIGAKSAMKIIVELQDKVGKIKELDLEPVSKEISEMVDALESMGYSRENILGVVDDIDDDLTEQEKIQMAIKLLSS